MRDVVLCAGGFRSGSTWQYNVVRNIFCILTNRKVYAGWIDDMDASVEADIQVMKVHESSRLDQYPGSKVLTSYRDLRSVIASLCRMNWMNAHDLGYISSRLDDYISELRTIERTALYSMKYENMVRDRTREITLIAQSLGMSLTIDQANVIDFAVNRIEHPSGPRGQGAYDPVSLLHPGHIGDKKNNHEQYIPDSTAEYITEKYADWLIQRGYIS